MVEFLKNDEYLVYTPDGFVNFPFIKKTKNELYDVILENGYHVEVTPNHIFNVDGVDIDFQNLVVGDYLDSDVGKSKIKDIIYIGVGEAYDLCDVGDKNLYYTNNIVSHNCFLGSSHTLVPPDKLMEMSKTASEGFVKHLRIPFKDIFSEYEYRCWAEPVKGHSYVIGVDTSEGVGADYSVAIVLDVTNALNPEVVAVFRDNLTAPSLHTLIIVKLAEIYNNAVLAIECNSIGHGVVEAVFNTYEYTNLMNIRKMSSISHGIYSHHMVKLNACLWLRDYLSCEEVKIKMSDGQITEELKTFEKASGSMSVAFKALSGFNDDCVIALVWALYTLHESNVERCFEVQDWYVTRTNLKIPLKMTSYYSEYWSVGAMEDPTKTAYINGSRVSMFDDKYPDNQKSETTSMGFMDF